MSPESTAAAAAVPLDLAPRALRPTSWPHALAVFVTAAVVAFPRNGSAAAHGVVWAEDGTVALQGAYDHHGWASLLTPYQGYAILIPRLITSLISYFPAVTHGVLVNVAAVAVQAGLAVFALHVVRSHTSGSIAPWLVAAAVAAVPVGPEAMGSLVNLQWFLIFAACLTPLWEPRTALGRTVSLLILCATCVTSPFGVIPVAVAALSWWVHRRQDLLALLVAGVLALAVQVVVMLTAPPRQIPVEPQLNPLPIADQYVRHVLGDGVLGIGRYSADAVTSAFLPGVLVALAIVALSVALVRTDDVRSVALPWIALTLSAVTYAVPVGLSDLTGAVAPGYSGRYSVGPVLLLLVAVAVLVERVLTCARRRGSRSPEVVLPALVAGTLVGAVIFGLVTSWSGPTALRKEVPAWSSEVARGRSECGRPQAPHSVSLRIAPQAWFVSVPCRELGVDH